MDININFDQKIQKIMTKILDKLNLITTFDGTETTLITKRINEILHYEFDIFTEFELEHNLCEKIINIILEEIKKLRRDEVKRLRIACYKLPKPECVEFYKICDERNIAENKYLKILQYQHTKQ